MLRTLKDLHRQSGRDPEFVTLKSYEREKRNNPMIEDEQKILSTVCSGPNPRVGYKGTVNPYEVCIR